MAAYRVEVRPRAEKELAALPRDSQRRIVRAIDALAEEPRLPGGIALRGGEGVLRIRIGVYRVVYLVEVDRLVVRLVVLMVRVGHRREVYRQR